jgi:DNA-binding CsgD family transcriptional regulator
LENALGDASNFVTVVPATKNSPLVVVVVLRTADARTPAPTNVAVSRQRLTVRELQVSSLLKSGATNAEIAKELGISYHTARHHVQHVLDKLGVRSRTALRQSTSDPPSQCA